MEETILAPKRPREESETQQGEENVVGCEGYSSNSNTKRHRPYNHIDILSLLESEELEESTQDLSPLITTLQQEITNSNSAPNSSDSDNTLLMCPDTHQNDQNNLTTSSGNANLDHHYSNSNSNSAFSSPHSESDGMLKELDDEEINDEKEKVMRHLLEASDDELGIPNYTGDFGELDGGFNSSNGDDGFSALCNKLWELEDQTANYYALLQSELFL